MNWELKCKEIRKSILTEIGTLGVGHIGGSLSIVELLVGFAGISVCLDEATLSNIVVKKSCRGRGIGGELLESLIDICSELNLKTFTLEVNTKNEPAIHLYEKFGFKNLGIRKKYYNNTQDAYIMTKYDN